MNAEVESMPEVTAVCGFVSQADESYNIEITNPATSLRIVEPDTVVTCFAANPYAIKKIKIQNQDVQYFPRGLAELLPNLEEISINHCNLKRITAEDLRGLNKLKVLNLSDNELEILPDDLFTHVPQLKQAIFQKNKIKLALLRPLVNHVLVDLRNNEIVNILL